MSGRETIASCLAALLLLTPFFAPTMLAQTRYSEPPPSRQQRPRSPDADGQWHSFQKQSRPNSNRPNQARPPQNRPPQNQPGHAGNWLRRYKDMPPSQQRRALENDPQYRRLSPQQQARLQRKLQNFSSLPRPQQERVLNRMETWEHLTPDQKQRSRQVFQQLKQLSPDRREAVNRAIRGMRNLPPDQRDRLINSDQYRDSFSLQERVILSGAAHLPLAPGEGLQTEP